MELAKAALDIGLFTEHRESIAQFWTSRAGVSFDFTQPISRSVAQHRYNLRDGVLKVNDVQGELPRTAPGFGRIIVATERVEGEELSQDDDGTSLVLVPHGRGGVEHWAVEVLSKDEKSFLDFYESTLGLPLATGESCAVRCGVSLITCAITPSDSLPAGPVSADIDSLQRRGLSYITIQVTDVDAVCDRVSALGACVALAPVTLGKTARIAFLRDPVGNYIELSQRASLTGALPA